MQVIAMTLNSWQDAMTSLTS